MGIGLGFGIWNWHGIIGSLRLDILEHLVVYLLSFFMAWIKDSCLCWDTEVIGLFGMAGKFGAPKMAWNWILVGMDLRDESVGWIKDSSSVYVCILLVPFAPHSSILLLTWTIMDMYCTRLLRIETRWIRSFASFIHVYTRAKCTS